MRTITTTTTVYGFHELSAKAKQQAKDEHARIVGYPWSQEAMRSIEALAKHFGGMVEDYDIDWLSGSNSWMRFRMFDMDRQEIQNLLDQLGTFNPDTLKGHGDCKLTGYCQDEDAIDGFRKAFLQDGCNDLDELMRAAFRSWITACCADCDYQYSDEAFEEMCEANEYEFNETGRLVRG